MGSCLSCEEQERSHSGRKDRKKEAREALAAEARHDQRLALVTGRICSNGASNSAACLFTQQGRKGVNQDAMIVWESFCSRKDTTFCGVFDGHGPYGHLVARRVRDSLPSKLLAYWQEATESKNLSDGGESEKAEEQVLPGSDSGEEAQEPEMFKVWKETHLKSYKVMDKDLRVHPIIDCFCSGTTAVTLIKQGDELVLGNVGDSRAVMGSRADDNSIRAVQLTVDLKPNLPAEEAERIRQCKGRVFALHDEPEVARVWLPHDNSPGLAMARAFGDFCLKDFGVIAVPEVSYYRITERDQFVVLATDGVWDVLSNEEVVKIVATAPTKTTSARSLVESAVRAWRLKYPTSKMDDCAVVCLYLNKGKDATATQEAVVKKKVSGVSREETKVPAAPAMKQQEEEIVVAEITEDDLKQQQPPSGMIKLHHCRSGRSEASKSRSLKECLATDENEWSALDGVTRVNSLLHLPRFLGGDKITTKKKH
ncbi:probable protein phosphatase 2C 33 isoform X1 [Selaginella moellendorffii]|uniref:probable protein phosphatase 2C 33 isoform X1 n=1 Tax=Selaginella moellendorffii TaxID=88036 RepID=UPI000D1CF9EE|nr:probable protein phosphatase 2C 33 isoform X1 [Selaginella moellendorffii]|eukprot:XP_024522271.1 probable protein phosphatase 2C 33 isoform X1 [Selaginella moellendorffii]